MYKVLRYDPSRFGISKTESVLISDIVCVVGEGNYSWLYVKGRPRPVLISITLKKLHESFPSFVRIHKRYVANLDYMISYQFLPYRGGALIQLGDLPALVTIARRRAADIEAIAREKGVFVPGVVQREDLYEPVRPGSATKNPLRSGSKLPSNGQKPLRPNDVGKHRPHLNRIG